MLCLQEIAQGCDALGGAPGDQPAQLQALLSGFALFFGAAVDGFSADGQRQRFGNQIATRVPVAQVQHHALPWPGEAAVNSMPRMCSVVTVQDPALGALRIMTTHLEYCCAAQRLAQARALHALHAEACERAAAPPLPGEPGTPFQPMTHTAQAILCGDFNCGVDSPAYALLQQGTGAARLHDAWPLLLGATAHAPSFVCSTGAMAPTRWPATSSSSVRHLRRVCGTCRSMVARRRRTINRWRSSWPESPRRRRPLQPWQRHVEPYFGVLFLVPGAVRPDEKGTYAPKTRSRSTRSIAASTQAS